ncbi:MAG TPA: hypothetical protein VN019_10765 [Oxalicibacterium sp.]|nr:hypothetical protein [Oxalicibacterium sp.]
MDDHKLQEQGEVMAGNKRPNRKKTPKGIGTPQRMVERMETGLAERHKRNVDRRDRNLRLTKLPLGHPTNQHVLDWTFGPLHKMFDEHERTGTHLFGDDGVAVMWVERDQCYTPIVEACVQLHNQFEFTAGELEWGDVPAGLLAYGMKLAAGQILTDADLANARAAVQWMRDRLAGITCYDWYASMTRMEQKETA